MFCIGGSIYSTSRCRVNILIVLVYSGALQLEFSCFHFPSHTRFLFHFSHLCTSVFLFQLILFFRFLLSYTPTSIFGYRWLRAIHHSFSHHRTWRCKKLTVCRFISLSFVLWCPCSVIDSNSNWYPILWDLSFHRQFWLRLGVCIRAFQRLA